MGVGLQSYAVLRQQKCGFARAWECLFDVWIFQSPDEIFGGEAGVDRFFSTPAGD